MIRVEVQGYCQHCPEFEPDVERPGLVELNNKTYIYPDDTIIRCEYRQRCMAIKDHIENTINRQK